MAQVPDAGAVLVAVHEAKNQPVPVHVAAAALAPEENNNVPAAPPMAQEVTFFLSRFGAFLVCLIVVSFLPLHSFYTCVFNRYTWARSRFASSRRVCDLSVRVAYGFRILRDLASV